jgi:hypothetical protein
MVSNKNNLNMMKNRLNIKNQVILEEIEPDQINYRGDLKDQDPLQLENNPNLNNNNNNLKKVRTGFQLFFRA